MGREHIIAQTDTTAGAETLADAQQHDTAAHPNHLSATIDKILKRQQLAQQNMRRRPFGAFVFNGHAKQSFKGKGNGVMIRGSF